MMVLLYYTYTVLYPFSLDPYDRVEFMVINDPYLHRPAGVFK